MKKIKTIAFLAALACSVTAVTAQTKLDVWGYNDEFKNAIYEKGYGYKATHPNVKVDYKMWGLGSYKINLEHPSFVRKDGTLPDVMFFEEQELRKYAEAGLLLELDDLYAKVKDKTENYPVKVATHNGHVYAMSYKVYSGAIFYRRSLAKKYWGTDDPAEVQKKFKDLDTFLATARELKEKSDGKCKAVATTDDLFYAYKGARKQPWVVDYSLTIDPAMEKYMDVCKIMEDEGLVLSGANQWSQEWFDGMQKGKVMCYFLPEWGFTYALKTNAPGTAGDWAMCQGPSAWFWSGAWIAASKKTKAHVAAKEMIQYLATDEKFLEGFSKDNSVVVTNINVQNKLKNNFSDPFIGGQNWYKEFCDYAKKVDGSLSQASDNQIDDFWKKAVKAYANGGETKSQAIGEFKYNVKKTLGF